MFQFARLASRLLRIPGLQPGGLPHSDIHGSKIIGISPWLFAAYHVLRRLSVPRHPLYALMRLIRIHNNSDELLLKLNVLFQ